MRIVIHHRMCGRIDEPSGAFHQTLFACFGPLSLPIVPRATFRFRPDGPVEGERIASSGRSIARAYLTTWGFVLALACVFVGPALVREFTRGGAALIGSLVVDAFGFALGFAAVTSAFWLGKTSRPSMAGRFVGWLASSLGLFLVQAALAAIGIYHSFGHGL